MTYGRLMNLALRLIVDPKWYVDRPFKEPIHEEL